MSNHITVLEELLAKAKADEARSKCNTENRHLTTERAYEAANARVAKTRDRITELRHELLDTRTLLEDQQNEVCQQLSDMDESHLEWRNSRAHSTQGVNNQ
jgi:hypothetical protein